MMIVRQFILHLAVILFLTPLVIEGVAQEFHYLNRSPKALLMGDAFTAVADDEYSLFYNPAALARNDGFQLTPFNPDGAVTNALGETDRFKNFPKNDVAAMAERILGLPLYLRLGIAPGFKLSVFGFSGLAVSTTNLQVRNAIHPTLDIDHRFDRGFVFGASYTLGSGNWFLKRGKDRGRAGKKTSVGMSIKRINREGIQGSFDLFGTGLINVIGSGNNDIQSIRDALGFSLGTAWGLDAGIEHVISTANTQLIFGLSALDIKETKFKLTEGTRPLPSQEMIFNFGTALKQNFFLFDYTLSLDMHPINHPMDFKRKVHLGAQVGIPFIDFLFGINGGYYSYGAAIKLWPIKIQAGIYNIETGTKYHEEKGQRAIFYLSLFDFSFDA